MPGTSNRSGGDRKSQIDTSPQDGLPVLPKGRTAAFKKHWEFLLANLPEQALRRVDAIQLTILCDQLVEITDLGKMIKVDPTDLKARSLRLRIAQQVSRLSSQYGLSPSDRMRMHLEPEIDKDDPFTELLARMGANRARG